MAQIQPLKMMNNLAVRGWNNLWFCLYYHTIKDS